MPLSYAQYQGNGSLKNFDVPCEYLSKSHITVRVDGVDVPFTWVDTYRLMTSTAPAPGTVVEVRRTTPREDRLVTFTDGSTLVETDLNISTLQSFFLAQEAFDQGAASMGVTEDGQFSALLRRVTNLADPVDNTDAVTKGWVTNSVNTNVSLAIAAKDRAVTAEQTAIASKDSAGVSASTAISARDAAVTARQGAEAARDAAATSSAGASSQRGLAQSARDAAEGFKNEAKTALDGAVAARTAAEGAQSNVASNASAAASARTEAVSAKDRAITAETTAVSAKEVAATAASNAAADRATSVQARDAASASASTAVAARDEAVAARNTAVTARGEAVTAKDAAEAAAASIDTSSFPKLDGSRPFTGKQAFRASVTASASINIAPGAAVSAPVNGDLWVAGAQLNVRVNNVTLNLADMMPKNGTVTDMTGNKRTSGQWESLTNLTNYAVLRPNGLSVLQVTGTPLVEFSRRSDGLPEYWLKQMENNNFEIARRGGGNIIMDTSSGITFSFGTNGRTLNLQSDGNIVHYHAGGQPVWTPSGGWTSMRELKENLVPVENALDRVKTLNGYTYNMIIEGPQTRELGLIAEEVRDAMPEATSILSTPDKDYLLVRYERLTALLVEAVKELEARVAQLENP